jgi:MFS family permease
MVVRRVFVASDCDTHQNGDRKPKLAPDDQTILIPQPADDRNDPLNWSWLRKHAVLLCVSFGAFAGDFGMSIGIPATVLQSAEWHVSTSTINESNSLAVVMIGISSLVWIPLLNCWGRGPVLFWSTVLGLFFTLGCILAPTFPIYYAMRALQALTQGTGSSIGLALIQDMFFFHQYARKIGVWYAVFLISPFLGPMLGNFMVAGLGTWRPLFWLDPDCWRRDLLSTRHPAGQTALALA